MFEHMFNRYPCEPCHLEIVSPNVSDMSELILNSDIIYVGGGNTKSMLALWREWGVDKALKQAYEKGVILAGVSAGFVCWFESCITDSIPNRYTVLPCLGLLPGSSCPHYDGQKGRPDAYHSMIKNKKLSDGFAADDGVGLHFIDGKLARIISSRPDANAYRVMRGDDGQTIETIIKPEFLGTEENFHKYIGNKLLSETDIQVNAEDMQVNTLEDTEVEEIEEIEI